MKYNSINRKYENFKEKFNRFENKYYMEMQDYKEFKKENFVGIDKLVSNIKKILIGICVFLIIFYLIVIIVSLILFLSFTVFSEHSFRL